MSVSPARMPTSTHSVAVVGATGHTGRFVVRDLVRRGIAPIAVGRDAARLAEAGFADDGIAVREARLEDAGSLAAAFAGAHAVINCAGPFLDTAEPVAAAAIASRLHYLDVTAEQASAQATIETFGDAARDAGVIVMPAMGFFGGFLDLLVTAASDGWAEADRVAIGIALDRWHPTEGTRRTGARNTAPRMVVSGGRLATLPQPPPEIDWSFPAPFGPQRVVEIPFSEVPLILLHLRPPELHTHLSLSAIRDIRDPTTPSPTPADDTGRSAQLFLVEARVTKGARSRRAVARGRDIYGFSAPLLGEAVQRILDGRVEGAGAMAPGAAFDARDVLATLATQELTVEMVEG